MGVRERVFVLALLVCATAQQFPPSELLTTLTATSDDTCGDPVEIYYDPQLGKEATCDASIPEDAHPPNVVVEGQDNDEWWQSKGGQNESSIEIDLGDSYELSSVRLTMGHSYRPRGIVVEKMRLDGGNGYEPLEYVVESPDADCSELFGVEKADAYGDEATTVLCRSYASELPHLGGENVNVSLFGYEGNLRPQGDSVAFVGFVTARRIRIRFKGFIEEALVAPNISDFFTLARVEVDARCACNGYASTCTAANGSEPYQCNCTSSANVEGRQCDACRVDSYEVTTTAGNSSCASCECDARGSINSTCDGTDLGQCYCNSGVAGRQCDECAPFRFEFPNCKHCDDSDYGSCFSDLEDLINGVGKSLSVTAFTDDFFNLTASHVSEINRIDEAVDAKKVEIDRLNALPGRVSDLNSSAISVWDKSLILLNKAKFINASAKEQYEMACSRESVVKGLKNLSTSVFASVTMIYQRIDQIASSINASIAEASSLQRSAEMILSQLQDVDFSEKRNTVNVIAANVLNALNMSEMAYQHAIQFSSALDVLNASLMEVSALSDNVLSEVAHGNSISAFVSERIREIERRLNETDDLESVITNVVMDVDTSLPNIEQESQNINEVLGSAESQYETANATRENVQKMLSSLETILEVNLMPSEAIVNESRSHASVLMSQSAIMSQTFEWSRPRGAVAVAVADSYMSVSPTIEDAIRQAEEAKALQGNTSEHVVNLGGEKLDESALESKGAAEMISELAADVSERVENIIVEMKPNASSTVHGARSYFDLAVERNKNVSDANASLSDPSEIESRVQEKLDCIALTIEACSNRTMYANSVPVTEETAVKNAENVAENASKIFEIAMETHYNASSLLNHTRDQLSSIMKTVGENDETANVVKRNISRLRARLEILKTTVFTGCQRTKLVFGSRSAGASYQINNVTDDGFEVGSRFTSASFYFRSNEPSGLLLYIGEHKDVSPSSPHFFAVEIVSGYVLLRFSSGGGSAARIWHHQHVNAGEWYHIYASRHYHYGGLTLSTLNGAASTYYGREEGGSGMLMLQKPVAVLGGISPDMVAIEEGAVNQTSFIGTLDAITLNRQTVDAENTEFNVLNSSTNECPERNATAQPVFSAYFFGDSFLELQRPPVMNHSVSAVSFYFSTDQASAQLLFVSDDSQRTFLAIGVRNHHPLLIFNCGSGSAGIVQASHVTLANREWHFVNVSLAYSNSFCRMNADVDGFTLSGYQFVPSVDFTALNSQLYVGGIPDTVNSSNPALKFLFVGIEDYRGCIRNVTFGDGDSRLRFDEAVDYRNVEFDAACPDDRVRGFSFKGQGYGQLVDSTVTLSQLTVQLFSQTESGILFFARGSNPRDFFYVAIFNGDLIVMVHSLNTTHKIATCGAYVHDGQSHSVSLSLNENSLSIGLDGSELNQANVSFERGFDANGGQIYVGGMPDNELMSARNTIRDMPVSDGFVGCIQSLEINENNPVTEFMESVNIDLQGCGAPATSSPPVQSRRCPGPEPGTLPPTQPDITTPPAPTLPPTNPPCVPENVSSILGGVQGTLFERDSFFEFDIPDNGFRSGRTTLTLEFRTFSAEGVLFYVSSDTQNDFFALELREGKVRFAFDCGNLPRQLITNSMYNDGEWHSVTVSRRRLDATLTVDESSFTLPSATATLVGLQVNGKVYIGGTPESLVPRRLLLGGEQSRPSAVACFRTPTFNGFSAQYDITSPIQSSRVGQCRQFVTQGAFYDGSGYLSYYNSSSRTSATPGVFWKPGVEFTIRLRFRTNAATGLLLYMSNPDRSDYIMLGIFDGLVIFSFDNGGNEVVVQLDTARLPVYVCDGQWHNLEIQKVVRNGTIVLDGNFRAENSAPSGNAGVDVYAPILIGGIPDDIVKRGPVVDSFTPFRGCIDSVVLTAGRTVTPVYGDENAVLVGVSPEGCPLQ